MGGFTSQALLSIALFSPANYGALLHKITIPCPTVYTGVKNHGACFATTVAKMLRVKGRSGRHGVVYGGGGLKVFFAGPGHLQICSLSIS